jgi:hypothetical protein
MSTTSLPLRPRAIAAILVATIVYAAALLIVHSAAFAARPGVLSAALAFDLVVTVPAAYWWLVVRPGTARARTLLPVVALSVIGAKLVLPAEHRAFVGLVRYATAPLELLVVGYAVRTVTRTLRARRHGSDHADVAEALDGALVRVFGERTAAHVVAAELATLHYALLARRAEVPNGVDAFAQSKAFPASLVWALGAAMGVEGTALHLWLAPAHPRVAWTLTALTAYSLLWLVGHRRATALRPITVSGRTIALRSGLRLSARLDARDDVERIERLTWRTTPKPARDYVNAARPGTPNVLVTLRRPTPVTVALGLRKTVTRVGLAVDEPDRFVERVTEAEC